MGASQGPSLSGHSALKLPGSSVLLMLTRHPCIDLLHWSHSTRPICLSLSIQKLSYHVCVHIIIPCTQYLSRILFCVSVMSGDSAPSHVFCCARRHIVSCCVYQSELGAVCGPEAVLHRRVGVKGSGSTPSWVSRCTEWPTGTFTAPLMIKCIMLLLSLSLSCVLYQFLLAADGWQGSNGRLRPQLMFF